jgi:predicted neuraminidase
MSFSVLNSPESPEVHASTLLVAGDYLLSAWFGGTKEGHTDTKIWLSRRRLQKETEWTTPEVVASTDGEAHWNPVLLSLPKERRIVLFYKVGSPISSWRTYMKDSYDGGNSWSEAQELVHGDKGD